MADREDMADSRFWFRDNVALCVIVLSFVCILVLVIGILGAPKNPYNQMMWSGLLPLFGTWVGTVLVFYFSKEGFQAASESVRKMAETAATGKPLETIPVKDKMITIEKMFRRDLSVSPAASINLLALIDEMLKGKLGQRIPILKKGCPEYVIHASMIYKYLADPEVAREAATLEQFLAVPKIKEALSTSFALVNENATLADAKAAMESYGDCQDVFVTKKGAKNEEVIGWITNVTIAESAKL